MRSYAIAVALLASLCCAKALECYVCNSQTDSGCDAESLKGSGYLTNCSIGRRSEGIEFKAVENAQVCWKQRQDVEGTIIVDRSCGKDAPENRNNCYDRVGTKKIKVRYCVCTGSACNGAASLVGSGVTFTLLLLVGTFLRSAAL